MFNTRQQEIQYIGKFSMYIAPLGYYKHEIYPIVSIDSKIINKDIILKWFEQEIQTCRMSSEKAKSYGLNHWKDNIETLRYERIINDGYGSKIGAISFEIYEESRLREKKEFLEV